MFMKKILFYIDPLIDNGNPLFRYTTLKHHVPTLQRALQRHIDLGHVEFRVVVSECLLRKARREGLDDAIHLVCLPTDKLGSAFSRGELPSAIWQNGLYNEAHLAHYQAAIIDALGDFVPDTILVYESCAPYFNRIFPNARVLNETWGMFSRVPMPALTTLDPFGTYQNSVLFRDRKRLRELKISAAQQKTMHAIRALVAEPFIHADPCYEQLLEAKADFRKVILFPLQIDHYYSFTETSGYPSHAAMLEDVFQHIPEDIGVIVTQHQDHRPVLDDAGVDRMRRRFRHFIHFDGLANVPMLSSFMVQYVDAVLTVSSAIAFHAALMKIPVFVIGDSHASVVSSGGVREIAGVLQNDGVVDLDHVLYWILTHYQCFTDVEQKRPENILALLDNVGDWSREGLDFFRKRYDDDELLDLFARHRRSSELEQLLRERGVFFRKNELYAKIVAAKAVSYDLFDTLVVRPFIEPHYLFQLLEQKVRRETGLHAFPFMRFRRMAEEAARKERGGKETTLHAIYRHLEQISGLSRAQCECIAQLEFEAEKTVLQRREAVHETLLFAKKLGKIVSIITDIYLDESRIRELLEAVKINGVEHLLVSATQDRRKHDGTIYPDYLGMIFQQYRISPDGVSILHIGDNGHADCDMAMPFGIRAHVLPKSIDNLKKSRWNSVFAQNFRQRHVISDVLVGLIANRFDFALSAAGKATLFGNSLFRAGYAAAGPMLFSFVQWLIRRIRERGHDRVYFIARDGYVLKSIYDRIRASGAYDDLPESGYLYASRRCAAVPTLFAWNDIVDLYHLSFGNRKLGEFIESRFGLPLQHIDPAILKSHAYSLQDVLHQGMDAQKHLALLKDLAPAILENAHNERLAFKRYLKDNGIETGRENCCLVDIGYSGSIQRYINRVLGGGAGLAGYYMLTHEAARRSFDGIVCEGFYNSYDEQRMADCHPLNQHVFLFESVLSSKEGSVVRHCYDEHGRWNMVTKESNREIDRQYFMMHVHAGVDAFAADLIKSLGAFLDDVPLGPYLGSKPFFHLAMQPVREDAMLFAGLKVENGFGGGDAWLLYDARPFLGKNGTLDGKVRGVAMGSSQWKEAALAAYAEPPKNTQAAPSASKADSRSPVVPIESVRTRHVDLPKPVRKYIKFRKNPYRFFNDSRSPIVRPFRLFFLHFKKAA